MANLADASASILIGAYTSTPVYLTPAASPDVNGTPLNAGHYEITTDTDCRILQGPSGIDSTLSSDDAGHLLVAGQVRYLAVSGASDAYVAARGSGGSVCLSLRQPSL